VEERESSLSFYAPDGCRGLIFDCDGTLADTMPAHYLSWSQMLSQHGLTFSLQQFYELAGIPTENIIRLLAREQAVVLEDEAQMVQEKEHYYLLQLAQVAPVEAVVQVAANYRGKLPLAVASGGQRTVVQKTLDALGILDWFDAIVCAEDTVRHKPAPDVFLEAARRIGVAPAHCVGFEDAELGLEALRRAGMLAVDVRPWYRTSE
jgi:beta-phosphoglucomutase family hydrolase